MPNLFDRFIDGQDLMGGETAWIQLEMQRRASLSQPQWPQCLPLPRQVFPWLAGAGHCTPDSWLQTPTTTSYNIDSYSVTNIPEKEFFTKFQELQ